jgi:pantothenate kinase type III
VIVDARSPLPITLDVLEPLTVGADRIVNTLAASRLFGRDTIVVDLGTATTFDCITADGVFLGGVIAPGMRTSAETLIRRTSKLPATELVAPEHVIGRRTEDCIRAGVVFGTAESVDGIVRRIKGEWPTPPSPGGGWRPGALIKPPVADRAKSGSHGGTWMAYELIGFGSGSRVGQVLRRHGDMRLRLVLIACRDH